MKPPVPSKTLSFLEIDDFLHAGLALLGDIKCGNRWYRCVEFHFGREGYAAGDSYQWHLHKELQLEIVLAGKFEFLSRGFDSVILEPGAVYVIPPATQHRWKCLKKGNMIGVSLAIAPRPGSVPRRLLPELPVLMEAGSQVRPLMDMLMREFNPQDSFSLCFPERLACWMFLIITTILNDSGNGDDAASDPQQSLPVPQRGQRVVSTLIRFIDANIGSRLSTSQLSNVVGLSPRHINRLFVEVTGSSCHAFVLKRRLEASRAMLLASETESVKEIAYLAGFASPAHFSAAFRKAYGIAPTGFRDKNILLAGSGTAGSESFG